MVKSVLLQSIQLSMSRFTKWDLILNIQIFQQLLQSQSITQTFKEKCQSLELSEHITTAFADVFVLSIKKQIMCLLINILTLFTHNLSQ